MSERADVPVGVVRPAGVARALRSPVRRLALAVVLDRGGPVAVGALPDAIVARAGRADVGDLPGRRELRRSLHHRHLPTLATVDLVEWTAGGEEVRPGSHGLLSGSILDPARLCRDAGRWQAFAAVHGEPRRRIVLATLRECTLPIGVSPLARVVAAERVGELAPGAPVFADVATRLHHVDLPLLAEADVLTYDATKNLVVSTSEPDVPIPVGDF